MSGRVVDDPRASVSSDWLRPFCWLHADFYKGREMERSMVEKKTSHIREKKPVFYPSYRTEIGLPCLACQHKTTKPQKHNNQSPSYRTYIHCFIHSHSNVPNHYHWKNIPTSGSRLLLFRQILVPYLEVVLDRCRGLVCLFYLGLRCCFQPQKLPLVHQVHGVVDCTLEVDITAVV